MSQFGRRILGAGLLLASASFSNQALATFPSVSLTIHTVQGPLCVIKPGAQIASGEVVGINLEGTKVDISIDGETVDILVNGVAFGNTAVPHLPGSFSAGLDSGPVNGSGFATGDKLNVTGFFVTGTGIGSDCNFTYTAVVGALGGQALVNQALITFLNSGSLGIVSDFAGSFFRAPFPGGNAQASNSFGRGFSVGKNGFGFSSRGLSAGGADVPLGVWGNFSYTDTENDFAATAFESTRVSGTLGADWNFYDKVVVGFAVGYEAADTDTTFNLGTEDVDGYSIIPYLAVRVFENTSFDLAFGTSNLEVDQVAGAARGSTDAKRVFVSGNVNYSRVFGDWYVGGRGGVIWAKETRDAFTDTGGGTTAATSFRIGRFRLGGEVARSMGAWEPFLGATWSHSFEETNSVGARSDRSDVLLDGGVRYFGSSGLSGSLGLSTLLGREDTDEYTVNLLIRQEF